MAEKVIGLRIQLNGFNGVVTSIQQLEEELKKAKQDLNELEIGSNNFKTLQAEISRTEGKLIGLRKASEGIGLEKQLEGYGKLAGGITSSFAAAQAAVALFGSESTVVAEAAAQAQNLLTLALAARGIEEVAVGAQIVIRTVAEKAATAATLTANAALKTLYTTIAANPIGALVTAIGLLIAAVITFNAVTDDSITIQEEFNKKMKEGQKTILERQISLQTLGKIVNDNTQSEKTRLQALDELKKILPELKNLTLDNKQATDLINQAIERNIQLIRNQVESETLKEIAVEKAKLAQEALNETLEEQTNFLEEVLLADDLVGVQKIRQERLTEKQTRTQKDANIAQNLYLDSLRRGLPLQREQNEILEDQAKKEKAIQESARAKLFYIQNEIKLITEDIKLRQQLLKVLDASAPEPEIIKKLTEQLNVVLNSIQATRSEFTKLFDEDFKTKFKNDLQSVTNTLKTQTDEFGKIFLDLRKNVSQSLLSQNGDFKNALTDSFDILSKDFKDVNKEAFDAGVATLKNYELLQEEIEKQPPLFQDNLDINLFYTYLKDFKIASGDLVNDFDSTTGEITKSQLTLSKTFTEASTFYENYVKNLIFQNAEALKSDEVYVKKLELGRQDIIKSEENLEIRRIKLREFEKEVEQERITEATNRVQNIINASNAIINTEQEIINFNKKAIETREELQKNSSAFIQSLFVNESENIIKIGGIELQKRKGIIASLKKEFEDFNTFREREEKRLSELFPEFEKLSADERLKILETYYKKVKEQRDKNTEDEKKSAAVVSQSISETIRNLTNTLQLGVEIIATSIELQLARISQFEEQALSKVVGNTEEAEQKRLEIQTIYEEKRKELTKKGQIAQLQLSRAQALANVAEAVTKALTAGPLIGQILAGFSAALGLVQIGVITSQIGQVNSLQGGGFISGPSHEQGGVYAGGGYVLEGNESVINRQSTLQYSGLLSQINQQGGGRPIMVQSPMDSRLVEALAKQKSEPIRAYVVEQDITKAQTINRRLEQLASF
jgi:hypothetical protein